MPGSVEMIKKWLSFGNCSGVLHIGSLGTSKYTCAIREGPGKQGTRLRMGQVGVLLNNYNSVVMPIWWPHLKLRVLYVIR